MLQALTLGPLATNCYLVWEEGRGQALLVDAAGDSQEILRAARQRGLQIQLIVNTHGHSDHVEAVGRLKQLTGASLAIHELDAPMLCDPMLSGLLRPPKLGCEAREGGAAMWCCSQDNASADRLLREGDRVGLGEGDLWLSVLHTPGHTPGSICLLGEGVLFSGDCLFAGGIGRVDLPGGDERAMLASLRRLARLAPDLIVYPGHGPPTTIKQERDNNPWLCEL